MADTSSGTAQKDAFGLLRANTHFRMLWISRTISVVGSALGLLSLILYTASSTEQGYAVALLMLVGDFAPTLLSPVTGTVSDRLDRRSAMIVCELAQGAIIALIALISLPLPLLLLLVALQSTVSQIFAAALRSSVPALVDDNDLESANAALGLGTTGLELLGPLLASVLLPFLSLSALLLVDAATFVISALLLVRLPSLPGALTDSESRSSFFSDAKEGMRYIWERPAIRTIALGFFAVVACTAIDDVALVFLAKESLGAGESGTSILYAGSGIGLLLGFVLLARFGHRMPALLLLVAGYLLNSSGNLFTGLSWAVPVAFTMQAVRGMGLSLSDMANNTLIQRLVPRRLLGRVFGNIYGAIGMAASLSYMLGGILIDITNPRFVFVLAGAGGLISTAIIALTLPAILRRASPTLDEPGIDTTVTEMAATTGRSGEGEAV
jgi:MFS family permease